MWSPGLCTACPLTGLVKRVMPGTFSGFSSSTDREQGDHKGHPYPYPLHVAAPSLFLWSALARYIQGTAIAVDGGATPGIY